MKKCGREQEAYSSTLYRTDSGIAGLPPSPPRLGRGLPSIVVYELLLQTSPLASYMPKYALSSSPHEIRPSSTLRIHQNRAVVQITGLYLMKELKEIHLLLYDIHNSSLNEREEKNSKGWRPGTPRCPLVSEGRRT